MLGNEEALGWREEGREGEREGRREDGGREGQLPIVKEKSRG